MNSRALNTLLASLFAAPVMSFAADLDLEAILDSASAPVLSAAKVESNGVTIWFQSQFPMASLAQTIVAHKLNQSDWLGALQAMPTAIEGTPLQSSPSGKAFQAWLYYKSGLKISGLEMLWRIGEPEKIDLMVQKLWRDATSVGQPEWNIASFKDVKKWEAIFSGVSAWEKLKAIDIKSPLSQLTELVAQSPEGSDIQNKARWNLVLALSLNDQAGPAAKELAILIKNKSKTVSLDLMNLTAGRLLYQNSYFDAASKFYQKIERKSDLWLESREELAWTFLRKGDAGSALSVTKDLLHPAFVGMVSPEVDLVDALAALRVCDYSRTLKTLNQFSGRYKTTYQTMSQLSLDPSSSAVKSVLNQLTTTRLTIKSVGQNLKSVPRAVLRDDSLYSTMQSYSFLNNELAKVLGVISKSSEFPALQADFLVLKQALQMRLQELMNSALGRVQILAKRESQEIHSTLKKMHIIEAEVIERMALTKPTMLAAKPSASVKIARDLNTLVFPDEGEVWFDEMTYSKTDATKACVR